MKTIKVVSLVLCCALCALAFLASAPSLAAAPCRCLGGGRTLTMTGSGASCAAANANLDSMAVNAANNNCTSEDGTCLGVLNVTTACHQVGTTWQESGYLTYQCEVCF